MDAAQSHERVGRPNWRQQRLPTLGAQVLHVVDGEGNAELPRSALIRRQHGFMQAGALVTRADSDLSRGCGAGAGKSVLTS